jgi:phosphatidylserine/phosphatidylglycerophosphate/cardiolipin synthase-like enzyme
LFFEDSPMRKKVRQSGVTINAVAGNHVVMLGLDIDGTLRRGLRGFAIRRTDHTEEETYWMRGAKTFASVEPTPAVGEQFSSREHPFQSFQWSDYSAKPDHEYTYDVIALYGKPGELEERNSATVTIRTEPIIGADHTIFFNRGSIATQEYARRFQNKMPSEVGQAAYDWLSRGLAEGIRDFVGRAKNKNWTLKGAFYEFQWPAVIDAFREAKQRKVTVSIVFDDIKNATGPRKKNEKAIAAERLKSVCIPRTNGTLMHNKFIVLIEGKKPRAVMFGSTNLTENGLYGHANCAHIVENEDIAAKYLAFCEKLTEDPETSTKVSDYKNWTIEQTPAPAKKFSNGMAAVFSPRADLDALNWYAELAGAAKAGLFMTFAFGMNQQFRNVYGTNDDVLRMGLMEKEWNGRNKDAQIAAIRKLQARPNVVIAIGNRIPLTNFDQWLGELDRATDHVNVHWIHTKFMLIDPLSSNPTVITGSANFSDASTRTNDENMVVIKKDTRVADIYLGEFMRLHSHYAFRQAVKIFLEQNPGASPEDFQQRFLIEEGDWTKSYFDPNDRQARQTRREYFSGKS